MDRVKIAPSILSADIAHLADSIESVKIADYLHIDIMDGHFVPNLSFSADTVKAIRNYSNLIFDVHLMISDPNFYLKSFADAGADIITVHQEVVSDLKGMAAKIHSFGIKAGLSIKPNTSSSVIADAVKYYDLILVMTVEPGFGGQSYIIEMNKKISEIRQMIDKCDNEIDLEVDGGITPKNIIYPFNAGANVFVAGSAIFKSDNPEKTIKEMRSVC